MDTSATPIVAIASGAIASRLILNAGMKRLTVEEKGRIVEAITPNSYVELRRDGRDPLQGASIRRGYWLSVCRSIWELLSRGPG